MNNNDLNILQSEAIDLLKKLIATPSFSKDENNTASLIEEFLQSKNVSSERFLNNIWARNKHFNETRKTILLNSHHDTVRPNIGYTLDPFSPFENENKLFGLGSNDAGGALVSLIATFLHYYDCENLKYNLIFAATAEEEISGINGIEALLTNLGNIDCAIVGEPTQMQMAVAERGLLVIDCVTEGKAGHAAREEGVNAIYKALKDIEWFKTYRFPKNSEVLGPVKMSVTSINTENKSHNITPSQCSFVADVRVNELYTFEEVVNTIKENVESNITPRSTRMRSTSMSLDHPLVTAGLTLGRSDYGSPTTSDKALMPFPALKLGPGDSARSHIADEFIYLDEIKTGIELYIKLIGKVIM